MRIAPLLLTAALLLPACSHQRINPSTNNTPTTTALQPSAIQPTALQPTAASTAQTTAQPSGPAPASDTTTTTATAVPATPLAATPAPQTAPANVNTGPEQTAQAFIVAAFTLNEASLRSLSTLSYADQAVKLWITPTDDFGATPTGEPANTAPEPAPRILATKVLANAAGQARIAVFVDAENLAVAALPYTVDLLQTNGVWRVFDAGLPTT
jgi:hypothetical protein